VYVLCIYVFIVCATSGSEVIAYHVYVKTSVLYITVAIFRATHKFWSWQLQRALKCWC